MGFVGALRVGARVAQSTMRGLKGAVRFGARYAGRGLRLGGRQAARLIQSARMRAQRIARALAARAVANAARSARRGINSQQARISRARKVDSTVDFAPGRLAQASVTPYRENKVALGFLSEQEARFAAFKQNMVRASAEEMLAEVLKRVPSGKESQEYIRALEVYDVMGLPKGEFASGARFNPKRRRGGTKKKFALLFVTSKRRPSRTSEAVNVLIRFGPWTAATIPFSPSPSEASILEKKVTALEVQRTEGRNRKEFADVRRLMDKCGRRGLKRPQKDKRDDADPVALTGLRMEFGEVGYRRREHWRPAVRAVVLGLQARINRDARLWRTIYDPAYKGWRTKPPGVTRIGPEEALKLKAFTEALNVSL